MSDVASFVASRVAANQDLGQVACRELALALRAAEELWRPLVRHDPEERFYHQLYRDPNIDIWLICWLDGQSTGFHDHDRSEGGVVVCEGSLYEDFFAREGDGPIHEKSRLHHAGEWFEFDSSYIHGVRHGGDAPATSIHVYSPALWRMGHYEAGGDGVIRRVTVTYADELLGTA